MSRMRERRENEGDQAVWAETEEVTVQRAAPSVWIDPGTGAIVACRASQATRRPSPFVPGSTSTAD